MQLTWRQLTGSRGAQTFRGVLQNRATAVWLVATRLGAPRHASEGKTTPSAHRSTAAVNRHWRANHLVTDTIQSIVRITRSRRRAS